MNFEMWRAPRHVVTVRATTLGIIAAVAIANVVQGVASTPAFANTAQDAANVVADDSIAVARIEAPTEAEFDFAAPKIKVEVPAPVAVSTGGSSSWAITSNPPPQRVDGAKIIKEAGKYVGSPYLAGGSSPKGFDCSGFTSYVYGKFGVSVPRSSSAYYGFGVRISAKDAKPGDLILIPGHVGIFAGNGMMIDAPNASKTVQFRKMWAFNYIYIRVP